MKRRRFGGVSHVGTASGVISADVDSLDGQRYVEPAEAGGGGEPVTAAFSDYFPLAPSTARAGFFSGQVAQLVEHMTENHGVGSSILPLAMVCEPPEGMAGCGLEVRSSIGRAPVSKTGGWGFESLRACKTPGGPDRLVVRTPGFQPGNRGSIPRRGM